MNADLVNILSWQKPEKSAVALLSVNIVYWFLASQRPIFIVSTVLLIYYVKYLWTHRISPEVLVDPPDHESWVTLSSYDMQHASFNFIRGLWTYYWNLREENVLVWSIVTSVMCLFFAKLGTYFSLLTLIFVILNGAFAVVPLLRYVPKEAVEKINDFFPPPGSTPPRGLREQSAGPDSLMLESDKLPTFEDESEDDHDFMFDPKHFESSSSKSSSASGSFEVI